MAKIQTPLQNTTKTSSKNERTPMEAQSSKVTKSTTTPNSARKTPQKAPKVAKEVGRGKSARKMPQKTPRIMKEDEKVESARKEYGTAMREGTPMASSPAQERDKTNSNSNGRVLTSSCPSKNQLTQGTWSVPAVQDVHGIQSAQRSENSRQHTSTTRPQGLLHPPGISQGDGTNNQGHIQSSPLEGTRGISGHSQASMGTNAMLQPENNQQNLVPPATQSAASHQPEIIINGRLYRLASKQHTPSMPTIHSIPTQRSNAVLPRRMNQQGLISQKSSQILHQSSGLMAPPPLRVVKRTQQPPTPLMRGVLPPGSSRDNTQAMKGSLPTPRSSQIDSHQMHIPGINPFIMLKDNAEWRKDVAKKLSKSWPKLLGPSPLMNRILRVLNNNNFLNNIKQCIALAKECKLPEKDMKIMYFEWKKLVFGSVRLLFNYSRCFLCTKHFNKLVAIGSEDLRAKQQQLMKKWVSMGARNIMVLVERGMWNSFTRHVAEEISGVETEWYAEHTTQCYFLTHPVPPELKG